VLFNSIEYFIFLPIVLSLYWLSPHGIQNKILLASSYLFYGLWDIRFLFLIVLSTGIDFLMGILISEGCLEKRQFWKSTGWVFLSAILYLIISWPPLYLLSSFDGYMSHLAINYFGLWVTFYLLLAWLFASFLVINIIPALNFSTKRKVYLAISVCVNLLILAFFKYFNFFIDSAEGVLGYLGANPDFFRLDIILPVGISFYTFQTMSYSLDIYRGKIKSTQHFLDFALFVAYFPQLVAGPIERASNLLPRIINPRTISREQVNRGLVLIFWGLFKKIAIADGVAVSVNSVYNTSGNVTALDVVFATVLFAIQIYCDFSAYSDIARGTSKLMGIELMRNFNLPYFSRNPSEFWLRWHISLSSWLRDYLYIPLGGNKGGTVKTYRNLMVTMLLGGLWHGAAWNYVLWGAYQGGVLSIYRFFSSPVKSGSKSMPFIQSMLTIILFFSITCYGWLLFRSVSLEQIISFTRIILFEWDDLSSNIKRPPLAAILGLPILVLYEFYEYISKDVRFYKLFYVPVSAGLIALIIMLIAMGLSNEPSQFIYFQF